ncbi:hypothetical protein SAY87_009764 [Trapa incisa]|uniref:Cytochrome P450 714A1 n=1 Tax=Trapa incisa TaxID=236973 RepID=A0AAN7JZW2_9MYRT|nr:hypothetical protein SAY87_009764 [Trapa incisa]
MNSSRERETMEILQMFRGVCAQLAVVALLGAVLFRLYSSTWRTSERLRKSLAKQGVGGPRPSLFYGNVPEMQRIQAKSVHGSGVSGPDREAGGREFVAHDYTSTLFPYFEHWRKQYGSVYTYSTGERQHLYVNQPEMVKELNQCFTLLGKPSYLTKRLAPLLGNGILRSNGPSWAQQRKIVAPEFFMDKVKGMVGLMGESAEQLLRIWDQRIEAAAAGGGDLTAVDIEVDEDLREFSADVISRACFGSSYAKGKEIFSKLRSLQKTISKHSFLFGHNFLGFLPTKKSREMGNLEREIESLIWKVIEEREHDCSEKDLVQMIMEGAAYNQEGLGKALSRRRFIVDNCKNIYFAGHEATSVAASWCLMLLALHPEWQKRVREEVGRVINGGGSILDAESLAQLKTVTMVIQEALRLYPPAAFVSREALEETKVGNITVPKGVCIWTLIPTLHRDPDIWGPDVNKFKPERFADGVTKACKYPQAYVPFGLGPRLCLGRNFALIQLKIVVSLIVSRYSFRLSPKYRHSPIYRMIVEPEHGVHLLVQKI